MTSPRALPRALGVALMAIVGASSLPTSPHPVAAWTSAIDGVTHGIDDGTPGMPSGTAGADIGRAITVGADGSIHVAGFFRSTGITLGDLTPSLTGTRDAFVTKLTPSGDPVWFTGIGQSGSEVSINDIEVSPDGGVVVGGEFKGTISVGADALTSSSSTWDGFIANFGPDGAGRWATRIGGSGDDTINDVSLAADGALVAVGVATGTVAVGSAQSTSPWNDTSTGDGIVVRLDSNGTATELARIGGTGVDSLVRVALAPTGRIVTTGAADTTRTVQVGTAPRLHNVSGAYGLADIIVVSLNLDGAVDWSRVLGGSGADLGQGVVIDSTGQITVAGHGTPPFTVGTTSHPGEGTGTGIVLSQFASDGTPRWTSVVDNASATSDEVRHLVLGPEDRFVTAGRLGSTSQSGAHFASMVHDSDGNLIRGPYLLGDPDNQIAQAAAVTTSGDLLLTGRFAGGPVDPTDQTRTLATTGGSDIVVIRIAGALQSSQTITFTAPADRPFSPTPFALSPTTDANGLSVALTSSTADVCTVTGLEVTTVGTGTCTLTASQTGERHYTPALPITHSFTVTPAVQTITFTTPDDRDLTSTPFALAPTTDASGLVVSLTSDTPNTCTVDGLEVTMLAAGTCTLTASQAGDRRYSAATAVTQSFTITAPTTTTPTTTTPTTTTPTTTTPTTTTSEPVEILPSTGFAPDGSTLPLLLGALGALVALVSRRRA